MTQDQATNGFIKYWQILVVLGTFAMGYGSMTTKMNVMADDLIEQKEKVDAAKDQRTEVEKSVVAIEKDVEHIKDKLEDQDDKLDRILNKLEDKE